MGERENEADIEAAKKWQAKKFDAGWAVFTWPKEYGGQGLGRMENVIFNQEEAKFKTPVPIYTIGHGMLGPTIMSHGTDEQKQKYIRTWRAARRSGVSSSANRPPARTSPACAERRARRQRLGDERPEDLEHRRAVLRLGDDRRAHRPERRRSTPA